MKKIKIENIPIDTMQSEADYLEKSMMYEGYCIITLFKDGLWTELSKKTPEIKKWVDNTEILKNIKGAYLLCLQKGKSDFPRHSDTQNESFGTSCGKLVRLHIPLITEKSIKTTCWNLESKPISHHMSVGNAYYFDTRKPHVISNESGINRVHLALDIEITQTVKDLLMDSPEISK
jgi:hypothetical protein